MNLPKFTIQKNILAALVAAAINVFIHSYMPEHKESVEGITIAVLIALGLKAHYVTPEGDKLPPKEEKLEQAAERETK